MIGVAAAQVLLRDLETERLDLRLHVLHEVHVTLFDFGIVGMTTVIDAAPRAVLGHGGLEFGNVGQPLMHVVKRVDRPIEQRLVNRLKLGKVTAIQFGRDECTHDQESPTVTNVVSSYSSAGCVSFVPPLAKWNAAARRQLGEVLDDD